MKTFDVNKRYVISVVLIMILAIVGAIVFSLNDATYAQTIEEDEIEIAHISDVHYFPYEDCYLGDSTSSGYKDTDFYKSIAGDTKLMKEGGTILNATISNIITESPDYLVVSGDITSNGELRAHYDVANAFRFLQEKMRTEYGKPYFQIFVVPGNHDVFNANACSYINEGQQDENHPLGSKVLSPDYITTSEAFAVIYNGLGYPYLNQETLRLSTIGSAMLDYYESQQTSANAYTTRYIDSQMASNVVTTYYSDIKGFPTSTDRVQGALSYIVNFTDNDYTLLMLDSTERVARGEVVNNENDTTINWSHITGGRLSTELLNWVKDQTVTQVADKNTMIGVFHHNLAEHFDVEEDYLKDFVLYNYKDAGTFLADEIGVRYVFTGHMHSCDRAQFVSYLGNVIQDFETGSLVSLGAPTRFTKISRINNDGTLCEDLSTITVSIQNIAGIKSINIDSSSSSADKYLFNNIEDLEAFIGGEIYDVLINRVLDSFVNDSLIARLDGLVAGLNISSVPVVGSYSNTIKLLANTLIEQIFYDLDYNIDGIEAESLIDYVHKLVFRDGLLGSIIYTENGVDYTLNQMLLYAYRQMVVGGESSEYDLDTEIGRACIETAKVLRDGSVVENLLKGILQPVLYEDNSLIHQLLNYEFDVSSIEASSEKDRFNSLVGMLIPKSDANHPLNNNGKLVVKNLLNPNNTLVSTLLGAVGGDIADNVSEAMKMGVEEWAKDFISKYMTDSFCSGIGGILADAFDSFCLDDTFDGNKVYYTGQKVDSSNWTHILPNTTANYDSNYTYNGSPLTLDQNMPTFEDGRLPSTLTNTFGDSTSSTQNFRWNTNYNVAGKFLFREKGTDNWIKATVTSQVVCVQVPLMDLGIFATKTEYFENKSDIELLGDTGSVYYKNIHNVTLTNLKSNTEYEYKVYGVYNGKEYCLQDYNVDWDGTPYTFKTALDKGSEEDFTFLAITDLQGTIKSSYEKANEALNAYSQDNSYDFIVNCGDVTDSGSNIRQWAWSQDVLSTIFGNTSSIVTAGNHEADDAALSNYYNFGNIGNKTKQDVTTGVYYSFNYGRVHFTVLNTNTATKDGLDKDQLKWLKEDLQTAKDDTAVDYTIVIMHKGLYSVGSHVLDNEVVGLRKQLVPIFYDLGVNIVLQGHDHTFSTTNLVGRDGTVIGEVKNTKNGVLYEKGTDGVMYMTLGTIADKFYEYRENADVEKVLNEKNTIYSQLDRPILTSISFNNEEGISIETLIYSEDGKFVNISRYKQILKGNALIWLWILLGCVGGAAVITAVVLLIVFQKKKKSGLIVQNQVPTDSETKISE